MAEYKRLRWDSSPDGQTRRERMGCDYDAYIPDRLMERSWTLDGDVAADIADAETEIARFDERLSGLSNTEGMARLLLRAEAVASSRIEGLVAGPRRVLRAEAAQALGVASLDVGADEILGNIRAMTLATADAAMESEVTPETILRIHKELLLETKDEWLTGSFRTSQNWIGGNDYNPCGAAHVPPPPEHVPGLMEDLCAFLSGSALSPLAQAGIAHAQFETIHPFGDGNGRTGRALIHLVLVRRALATRFVPPVSLVLATWSRRYIGGLNAFRYTGLADSADGRESLNQWLATFAAACRRSLLDAGGYESRVLEIVEGWRTALGPVRAGSAVERLLTVLPAAPIITVGSAAELIGRSFEATNQAVSRLVEAGVLRPVTVGRRNRAFEAAELVDAFAGLERTLASPEGDTRAAPPSRPVPANRER